MKKYFYIFKTTLIENLQYLSNIFFGFITFMALIFIMFNLWSYLYQDTSSLINGYSINQMIWYVTITELMWFSTRSNILINEISNDIKTGKIAYNINKPYNYVLYIISKYFGEMIIKLFSFIIFAIIFGLLIIGPLDNFNLINLLFVIPILILAILINCNILISISLTSFWIEETKPFHWIYSKLILVVGVLFPIEMFPLFIQPIIKYTPVFVVTYSPARLITNFSINIFYQALLIQIIYFIISSLLVLIMYQKGVKKLNVNGG